MQSSITSSIVIRVSGGIGTRPVPATVPAATSVVAPATRSAYDWSAGWDGEDSSGASTIGRTGAADARQGADLATAQAEVKDIRGFFSKLGVKDSEGNNATAISIDPEYPNAAYDPSTDALRIGVDPRDGTSFTAAPDVLAHEWSHRIVHHLAFGDDAKLQPEDLAIDESLADTFAAAYDPKNWTIGEALVHPVRNMAHPERDTFENPGGHPGSVADYERMFTPGSDYMMQAETNSGKIVEIPEPHALSAIPSKAASMIGDALGRDTMAKIYMKTVRDYLRPGKEIEGLAAGTIKSAADLFGASSKEVAATKHAWDAVGVLELIKPEHQ